MRLLLLSVALCASSALGLLCPVNQDRMCSPKDMQCPRGTDMNGCDLGFDCVPNMLDFECPNRCPCQEGEIECRTNLPTDPCPTFVCVPETQPSGSPYYNIQHTSMNMPGNPVSDFCPGTCPVVCSPYDFQCEAEVNDFGCMMEPMCVARPEDCPQIRNDYQGCPLITEDPRCGDFHMNTCGGVEDFRGCFSGQFCLPHSIPCPVSDYSNGCEAFEYVDCGPEMQYCDAPTDFFTGCQTGANTCVPMNPDGCPVACMECGNGFQYCPGPKDDTCHELPGACEPILEGNCYHNCPLYCAEQGLQECAGEFDHLGCQTVGYCSETCPPSATQPDGCPALIEPEQVGEGSRLCYNEIDLNTGCTRSPYQIPMDALCEDEMTCWYDPNVHSCPSEDPSMPPNCVPIMFDYEGNECPAACPEQEYCQNQGLQDCGTFTHDFGCQLPIGCSDEMGNCPVVCLGMDMFCHIDDPNNPLAGYCASPTTDFYGFSCPVHCEPMCADNEQPCPETYDASGCPEARVCMPVDGQCPESTHTSTGCPVIFDQVHSCDENSQLCTPMDHSPKGCEQLNECHPADVSCPAYCNPAYEMECQDSTGMNYCEQTFYSSSTGRRCWATCPTFCPEGMVECVDYDTNGCRMSHCVDETMYPEQCMPVNNDRGCPNPDPNLPAAADPRCDLNRQTVCYGYSDENGCDLDPFCADECPEHAFDNNGCPVIEHTYCGEREHKCYLGQDYETGCDLGFACQPMQPGHCTNVCPLIHCDPAINQICGSVFPDPKTNCMISTEMCWPINEQCPPEGAY